MRALEIISVLRVAPTGPRPSGVGPRGVVIVATISGTHRHRHDDFRHDDVTIMTILARKFLDGIMSRFGLC